MSERSCTKARRRSRYRPVRPQGYLRGFLAVLTIGLGGAVVQQSPASATAGCESPHCYSIQFMDHGQFYGVWGTWHRNNDNPQAGAAPGADPGAHINSEMWFVLNNGNYLETGLRNGLEAGNPGDCGCIAYAQFWADHTGVAAGHDVEYRHIIANVSPTGATDAYQISRGPSLNQWYVYLNGNVVGFSGVTGDWAGNQEQIGGEFQNTSGSLGRADDFDMYTRIVTGSGAQTAWDYRDGVQITGCAGLEGYSYSMSPTEWSWQKHATTC